MFLRYPHSYIDCKIIFEIFLNVFNFQIRFKFPIFWPLLYKRSRHWATILQLLMQKKFRLNEIHFLLRMRNLIVIRNILKILKKVSAAYSQKARALKIHFLLLLLLLNIINPALYVLFIWLPFICQFLLCVQKVS